MKSGIGLTRATMLFTAKYLLDLDMVSMLLCISVVNKLIVVALRSSLAMLIIIIAGQLWSLSHNHKDELEITIPVLMNCTVVALGMHSDLSPGQTFTRKDVPVHIKFSSAMYMYSHSAAQCACMHGSSTHLPQRNVAEVQCTSYMRSAPSV